MTRSDKVVDEIAGRFPELTGVRFALRSSSEQTENQSFLRVLVAAFLNSESGALVIVLPERERLALSMAVLASLHLIKQDFERLELDRLTTPIRPGQRVRVAPEGKIYIFVADHVRFDGIEGQYFGLRNPKSGAVSYHHSDQAFRITPTDALKPFPRKKERPSTWQASSIDQLLDIRTGGNLTVIPNQVILVAPKSRTMELVEETELCRGGSCFSLLDSISWGRIDKDGHLVSETSREKQRPPVVAVTHSVGLMALACGRGEDSKRIVVSGAGRLVRDLQAFDEVSKKNRLLVLADHSEASETAQLVRRGAEAWAPSPSVITCLMGDSNVEPWFEPTLKRTRNAQAVDLEVHVVDDDTVSKLGTSIAGVSASLESSDFGQRLLSRYWPRLVEVAEWIGEERGVTKDRLMQQAGEMETILTAHRQYLKPDTVSQCQLVNSLFHEVARDQAEAGAAKRDCLETLASNSDRACVVTRSSHAAARVSAYLDQLDNRLPVFPKGKLPEDHFFEKLILFSWPGQQSASTILSAYLAPRLEVICYDFEADWAQRFKGRWMWHWTRFRLSDDEVRSITGLATFADPEWQDRSASEPVGTATEQQDDKTTDEDPIEHFLKNRRKGRADPPDPSAELREAYYVGFSGAHYAHLTESHRLPVLTNLILQTGGLTTIPRRRATKLKVGDYVLFRDQGDSDVIAALAAVEMGEERYADIREVASRWREPLRSIGPSVSKIHKALAAAGLKRSKQAVRLWLNDEQLIGPGSLRAIEIIAAVSNDANLEEDSERVDAAMAAIRSAHRRAGSTLSDYLLNQLPESTWEFDGDSTHIDLGFAGGWVVTIEELSDEPELYPASEVNRLLTDPQW